MRYLLDDPQGIRPISVAVPSAYSGGSLVLADLCADIPGAKMLSKSFETSGMVGARANLIVLRGADMRFAERVESSKEVRGHIPEGQPLVCLVGNADGNRGPALVKPDWAARAPHEPSLELLREIELYGLLLGRKAILEKPGVHYEVGSGAHVRRYVRLRNALESTRDCRRIIDWILPSITEGSQVMIAHRGLGALEASLEASLARLFNGKIEIHRLPRYDESESRNPHVPVSMEPDESRDQVIVIGVDTRTSDPGQPGGEREKALNGEGYAASTKIHLVDTTYPEAATDAFVHVPIERHHAASCEYCGGEESWDLHKIDVDDEIPIEVEKRRKRVKVNRKGMEEERKPIWRTIESTGAASVHVDQGYEHPWSKATSRHRAVDIDVGKLLQDPVFRGRCLDRLTLAQPDKCLVLIPEHETGPALKDLAEAALGETGSSVEIVSRLDPAARAGDAIETHERIVLLDDMIASGSTMGWLAERVKDHLGPDRFEQIELHGFVILNCTPSEDELNSVRNNFTPGDGGEVRLVFCETTLLPHPDDRCPWCDELTWMKDQPAANLPPEHAEFFRGRIKELEESPLRQLSPVADAAPAIGTFIGNISATTAFVRWASALQARRAEVQEPGEGHPPRYYIDAGFVVQNWRDWCQCAGILRTASEAEVRYTDQEAEFERKWQAKAVTMDSAKLVEFAWAAIEEKLTAPSAALVLKTLEERAGEDPAIDAFRALLATRSVQA